MICKKITLTEKEELRIELKQLKGRSFVDVRVYAGAGNDGDKWPTGKGFLLPATRLAEWREAINELETGSGVSPNL